MSATPCILNGARISALISGYLHHVGADLLGRLAQLLDVGVAGEAQIELHRDPVAAEVGDLAELAERDGVDLAVLVAQLDRAQGEALDGALGLAAVDVFADAEGIVGQVEDARHDVPHQRLAAERDGEPETEAPAISGVMLTPKSSSATSTAMTPMTIAIAIRSSGIRVLRRDAGEPAASPSAIASADSWSCAPCRDRWRT